ncbi:D-Ala-D-Ala carboxypeptidase family metallohydrolase [Haloferula sp.]|uniref:D-Ala-D-Ala carboxypeptidase family metallohydrolase n=1 Tax=Haloferula sp. TaxID=2497595 RepID=UPI003C742C2B
MLENQACPSSPEVFSSNRRSALGVIGASSLALLGSATPASAFFFRKPAAETSLNVSKLPAAWVQRQGRNLAEYSQFIGKLRLRYVSTQQIIEAHAKHRGHVWNSLPPKSLWRNMAPTLKVLDRLAAELNQPVTEIISAYRSPAYNARCSGAKRGSWHQANVALDVKFPVRASVVSSEVRSLRSRGLFKGGVGRYYAFTHIDTRGQSVDW